MQSDWLSILRKILFLMALCFVMFIASVNVLKFIDFAVNIDNVVKIAMKDETTEIPVVDSVFNFDEEKIIPDYDQDVAHRAVEMGYTDNLQDIDLNQWSTGYNILIIGSDKHNYEQAKSRADVIVLLRISKDGKILSISIPRDTLITIREGKFAGELDKIGHSLFWADLDELVENVEYLLGVKINSTITMDNFRSFEALMAVIGGVSTDKILEGKLGIQWIRNRSFKFGDIERCRRQQVFLKKTVEKLWRLSKRGNYIYSSVAYSSVIKIVDTDLTKKEFLDLLYILKENEFDPEKDFYTSVLPGTFGTYNSVIMKHDKLACWQPDYKQLNVFCQTFNDQRQLFFEKSGTNFFDYFAYSFNKFCLDRQIQFEKKRFAKQQENLQNSALLELK